MTDLISFLSLVPLGAALVLLWVQNLDQARSLSSMADSLDELQLLQLRRRRDQYRKDLKLLDPLLWLSARSGTSLELISILSSSSAPSWVNLRAADGSRLVVSPLSPRLLRAAEGHRVKLLGRLGSANEPLLGRNPRQIVVSTSSLHDQEWFDLEAAEVGRQLSLPWDNVARLYFYLIRGKTGA